MISHRQLQPSTHIKFSLLATVLTISLVLQPDHLAYADSTSITSETPQSNTKVDSNFTNDKQTTRATIFLFNPLAERTNCISFDLTIDKINATDGTDNFLTNTSDETYFVGGGVVRLKDSSSRFDPIVIPRLPKRGYFRFSDGTERHDIRLFRHTLCDRDELSFTTVIREQDNKELAATIRVAAVIGRLLFELSKNSEDSNFGESSSGLTSDAGVTAASTAGEVYLSSFRGNQTIGGFTLIVQNEGGAFKTRWIKAGTTVTGPYDNLITTLQNFLNKKSDSPIIYDTNGASFISYGGGSFYSYFVSIHPI